MSTEKTQNVPTGMWGGDHINVEVTGNGASIEYDCAHGTIDQSISLDSHGRFNATGTHTREHPGPIREGESDGVPASYSGHMDGTTMTLTVTLTATKETIGTFTLNQGKRSRIVKCG